MDPNQLKTFTKRSYYNFFKVSNKSFKNKAGYYLIEGANHGITGTTSLSQCQLSGRLIIIIIIFKKVTVSLFEVAKQVQACLHGRTALNKMAALE